MRLEMPHSLHPDLPFYTFVVFYIIRLRRSMWLRIAGSFCDAPCQFDIPKRKAGSFWDAPYQLRVACGTCLCVWVWCMWVCAGVVLDDWHPSPSE